jgi:hypothetical protein
MEEALLARCDLVPDAAACHVQTLAGSQERRHVPCEPTGREYVSEGARHRRVEPTQHASVTPYA